MTKNSSSPFCCSLWVSDSQLPQDIYVNEQLKILLNKVAGELTFCRAFGIVSRLLLNSFMQVTIPTSRNVHFYLLM